MHGTMLAGTRWVGIVLAGIPSDGTRWVGIVLVGTQLAGIPAPGMTKGKHNENNNENCSLCKSFRDDPSRGFGQPGGNDVGIRSSEP